MSHIVTFSENSKLLSKIVTGFLFSFVTIILGFIIGSNFSAGWLLAAIVLTAPLVALSSKQIFWILVSFVFFINWLTSYPPILPEQLSLIVDALILIFLFKALSDRSSARKVNRLFIVLIGLFIIISLWSLAFSGATLSTTLLGLRNHLKYFLVFIGMIKLSWTEKDASYLMGLFVAAAIIQIPVALVQSYMFGIGDQTSGMMGRGGSGILALFQISAIVYLFIKTSGSSVRNRLILQVLIFSLLLPPLLGSALIIFIIIPIAVSLILIESRKLERKSIYPALVIFIAISLFVSPLAIGLSDNLNYTTLEDMLSSVENVVAYDEKVTQSGQLGRIDQLLVANSIVSADITKGLFGFGPGSVSTGSGLSAQGSLRSADSRNAFIHTAIAKTIVEFGYLGLFLMFLIIIKARSVGRLVHLTSKKTIFKQCGYALVVIAPIFLLSGLYTFSWFHDSTSLIFWALFGIVYVALYDSRQQIKKSNQVTAL